MPVESVPYSPALWSNFLSAQVSASAALTGLLFVAISINLPQIISSPHLTPRAAKALVTLAGVLFAASLCLVPGQSLTALGWELILLGVVLCVPITVLQRGASRKNPYIDRAEQVLHWALAEASALPLIVCGVSLLALRGGGLYWLVASVIISFISALLDAWVLLIEIKR
jgi:hypothetical protein